MSALEKLQRLAELDEQLKDLDRSRNAILNEMHKIIGEGFVVPGARIVPIKRGKNALPKADPNKLVHVEVNGQKLEGVTAVKVSPPAPPVKPIGNESEKEKASIAARVLSAMSGAGMRGITAPELAERLGITVTQAANAITYLSQTNRIVKVSPGTYRAK